MFTHVALITLALAIGTVSANCVHKKRDTCDAYAQCMLKNLPDISPAAAPADDNAQDQQEAEDGDCEHEKKNNFIAAFRSFDPEFAEIYRSVDKEVYRRQNRSADQQDMDDNQQQDEQAADDQNAADDQAQDNEDDMNDWRDRQKFQWGGGSPVQMRRRRQLFNEQRQQYANCSQEQFDQIQVLFNDVRSYVVQISRSMAECAAGNNSEAEDETSVAERESGPTQAPPQEGSTPPQLFTQSFGQPIVANETGFTQGFTTPLPSGTSVAGGIQQSTGGFTSGAPIVTGTGSFSQFPGAGVTTELPATTESFDNSNPNIRRRRQAQQPSGYGVQQPESAPAERAVETTTGRSAALQAYEQMGQQQGQGQAQGQQGQNLQEREVPEATTAASSAQQMTSGMPPAPAAQPNTGAPIEVSTQEQFTTPAGQTTQGAEWTSQQPASSTQPQFTTQEQFTSQQPSSTQPQFTTQQPSSTQPQFTTQQPSSTQPQFTTQGQLTTEQFEVSSAQPGGFDNGNSVDQALEDIRRSADNSQQPRGFQGCQIPEEINAKALKSYGNNDNRMRRGWSQRWDSKQGIAACEHKRDGCPRLRFCEACYQMSPIHQQLQQAKLKILAILAEC